MLKFILFLLLLNLNNEMRQILCKTNTTQLENTTQINVESDQPVLLPTPVGVKFHGFKVSNNCNCILNGRCVSDSCLEPVTSKNVPTDEVEDINGDENFVDRVEEPVEELDENTESVVSVKNINELETSVRSMGIRVPSYMPWRLLISHLLIVFFYFV